MMINLDYEKVEFLQGIIFSINFMSLAHDLERIFESLEAQSSDVNICQPAAARKVSFSSVPGLGVSLMSVTKGEKQAL